VLACAAANTGSVAAARSAEPFGKMPDGTPFDLYHLRTATVSKSKSPITADRRFHKGFPTVTAISRLVLAMTTSKVSQRKPFSARNGRHVMATESPNAKFTSEWEKNTNWRLTMGLIRCTAGSRGFDKVVCKEELGTPRRSRFGAYLCQQRRRGRLSGNLSVTAVYTLTDDNGLETGIRRPRPTKKPSSI